MNIKIDKTNKLICLKTGAKAKIVQFVNHKNISCVRVKIEIPFEDTTCQILKTIDVDQITKQFNYC